MTIICLNTWGGRAGKEKILGFFEKYRDSTDIFCLQEIWSDRYDDFDGSSAGGKALDHSKIMTHALRDISALLPEHIPYFRPHFRENYGLCMFIKKNVEVKEDGEVFVHHFKGYEPEGDLGKHARNIQYATILKDDRQFSIINFHGLWNGQGKGDSDERLAQSERMVSFLTTLSDPYILCGDFNLLPDTESLRKIEGLGLRNLITEYGITSTRTPLYDKPIGFADYAFVSDGIQVTSFEVLPDVVSDHAPLRLSVA